jgi:hypothetical protein
MLCIFSSPCSLTAVRLQKRVQSFSERSEPVQTAAQPGHIGAESLHSTWMTGNLLCSAASAAASIAAECRKLPGMQDHWQF